jgi:hypothetical protein
VRRRISAAAAGKIVNQLVAYAHAYARKPGAAGASIGATSTALS